MSSVQKTLSASPLCDRSGSTSCSGPMRAPESGDFGTTQIISAQDLAREAELLEKKLQTLRLAQGRIARDTERLATAIRSLRAVAVHS